MIPLSSVTQTSNTVQAVPVRFNPQLIVDGTNQSTGNLNSTHQIITLQTNSSIANNSGSNQTMPPLSQHILIPMSTKVTASPRTTALRKRDIEG